MDCKCGGLAAKNITVYTDAREAREASGKRITYLPVAVITIRCPSCGRTNTSIQKPAVLNGQPCVVKSFGLLAKMNPPTEIN